MTFDDVIERQFDCGATDATVELVEMRSHAKNGVLTVSAAQYRRLYELTGIRDRARLIGVDVDSIDRAHDDGLATIQVVVDFKRK